MKITTITRNYRYDGIDLPVPSHLADNEAGLRAYHASLYPPITTADAVDTGVSNGVHTIEYRRAIGTKG